MTLLSFSFRNLQRRRTRTTLTIVGVAIATMCLFSVLSFDRGYDRALQQEMERSGIHMFVSTEGCPTEAASLVLHGGEIPKFLPEERIQEIQQVPGIRAAAGMLIFAVPRAEGRLDLFYGIDEAMLDLKPYWKIQGRWPEKENEILLGSEAALVEKRGLGDKVYFESLDMEFVVSGILERTGTQDDGFFFLPLKRAQEIFHKRDQLTGVAVAVQDLTQLPQVEARIKELPDVYVVTSKQMTDEILRLASGSKALMYSILIVALAVSLVGVLNTILMSVFEMVREFGYMRCVGAMRGHIFHIVLTETTVVCAIGGVTGILIGLGFSSFTDDLLRGFLPYAPAGNLMASSPATFAMALVFTLIIGALAGVYPAMKASRISPMEAVRNE